MFSRVSFSNSQFLILVTSLGVTAATFPQPATAEIESLTIIDARDIGLFAGKPYREVEARMNGTAPGGPYQVPLTLAFPTKVADFDGFTVVDVINTITMFKEGFPAGRWTTSHGALAHGR